MTTQGRAAMIVACLALAAGTAGCARPAAQRSAPPAGPAVTAEPTPSVAPTASAEPSTPAAIRADQPGTAGSWDISIREVESNLKSTDDKGGKDQPSGGSGAGDQSGSGTGDDATTGTGAGSGARMKIEVMLTNTSDETLATTRADWSLLAGGESLEPVAQSRPEKTGERTIEPGSTEDATLFFDTPDINGVYTFVFEPAAGGPGSVAFTVP